MHGPTEAAWRLCLTSRLAPDSRGLRNPGPAQCSRLCVCAAKKQLQVGLNIDHGLWPTFL